MAQSYADKIISAKVMLSGLNANADKIAKRGLDALYLKRFEDSYQSLQAKDNEQEAIKARLKEKTAEIEAEMVTMEGLLSESKKIVKMDFKQESWKEFGIDDKK